MLGLRRETCAYVAEHISAGALRLFNIVSCSIEARVYMSCAAFHTGAACDIA